MANVSSSNGLEKRPKLRFPGFDEPMKSQTHLSQYLVENKKRNKTLIYKKSDCRFLFRVNTVWSIKSNFKGVHLLGRVLQNIML